MKPNFLSEYFNAPIRQLDMLARIFLVISLFVLPISTAATNVFMGLTLIAWLVAGGYKARLIQLHGHWFAYAVGILFVVICLGATYSSGSQSDILFLLKKYSKLLFILPAISLLQDEKWQQRALMAFSASMVLVLFLSLASVIWPLPFVLGTANGPGSSHHVFKDYIAQNLLMSFFAFFLAVKAQFANDLKSRIVLFSLAALAVVDVLFFVAGRTGYVSLALNAIVFIFFLSTIKKKIIGIILIFIVAVITLQLSTNFNNRVSSAVTEFKAQEKKELTSIGMRVEFFKKSIQLYQEKPFFGFGTGSYAYEFCRVADSAEWCDAGRFHPHNQFLAFLVQLGAIGLLAYLAFIAAAIKSATNQTRLPQICSVGLVATLIADSITHAPLFLVTEAQFFILLFSVFLTKSENTKIAEDALIKQNQKFF
jgi:O-antigen ligase